MSGKRELINNKLKELLNITELDKIKYELYGIITTTILSKEMFKRNIDIREFLDELSLMYREYVYGSRTTLLARVIRHIERLDLEEINLFIRSLIDVLEDLETKELKIEKNQISDNKVNKKKEKNYMEDLLKKYSRNKKD